MPIEHIIYVLKTAFRGPVRTPLGRWNIDNHKQTMLKITYANEDHCGSCSDNKISYNNEGEAFVENDDIYVHMLGVETVPSRGYPSRKYTIKSK